MKDNTLITLKALELLQDIYSTLEQSGAVWAGSLIFAENEPAADVLRKFLDRALKQNLTTVHFVDRNEGGFSTDIF